MAQNVGKRSAQNKEITVVADKKKEDVIMTKEDKLLSKEEIIAQVTALLTTTMTTDEIYNAVAKAVKLAEGQPESAPELVMAIGGHACGGWRKPLLQSLAASFGLVPCLVNASPVPGKPLGQQAAFFGPAQAARIASALYTTIYQFTNINGNKLLRDARAEGKKAGKSGSAGDRLQENVYNDFALKVLGKLETKAKEVDAELKKIYGDRFQTKNVKGGMVFNGSYNTEIYNGDLQLVTTK